MRTILVLLALAGVLLLTIPVSAEYVQWCPFSDEPAELAIGGYQIDAGMAIRSTAQEGVVLSRIDLWQQAGEGGQVAGADSVVEGQGYSNTLNGQGAWEYTANLTVSGNSIDTDRLLNVGKGRMNPSEDQFMMSYVCPPDEGSPYEDNLTHVIGAESAFASNYADILYSGGYATRGTTAPQTVTSDVAMVGQGLISVSSGYNAITGVSVNKTVPVTTYVLQGRIMVPVTTLEDQTVTKATGHTIYHQSWIQAGTGMDFESSFHYKASRAAPY